jgi:transcriptional regulator with XRE-family HTH domain
MTDMTRPLIGVMFKQWRTGCGYSIRDVETITGINKSQISRLEHDKPLDQANTIKLINFLFGFYQ